MKNSAVVECYHVAWLHLVVNSVRRIPAQLAEGNVPLIHFLNHFRRYGQVVISHVVVV